MPYVLISSKKGLNCGPTTVGDKGSNQALMRSLGAGKNCDQITLTWEYITCDTPREVLDKLESLGYSIISSHGNGQTNVWTLHIFEANVVSNGYAGHMTDTTKFI